MGESPLLPGAFAFVVAAAANDTAVDPVVAVGSTGRLDVADSTGLFEIENLHSSLLEQQIRQDDIHIGWGALDLGNMASCFWAHLVVLIKETGKQGLQQQELAGGLNDGLGAAVCVASSFLGWFAEEGDLLFGGKVWPGDGEFLRGGRKVEEVVVGQVGGGGFFERGVAEAGSVGRWEPAALCRGGR